MVATLRTFAALLVGSLAACLPPPLKDCSDTGCTAPPPETETGTADPGTPTTSDSSDPVQTLTSEPDPGSTSDTTMTPDDPSTGEPVLPPKITKKEANPGLIEENGVIEVDVFTENADGVHMTPHNSKGIELSPAGPNHFHGQITVYSGEDNGDREAVLVPRHGDVVGEKDTLKYTIQLPAPGEQKFWEAGDLIGPGKVAALDLLPDGLLVEFGTFLTDKNESRCYLRRRQKNGAWFQADFIPVLPDSDCAAIDMKIDRKLGTMHVLLNRTGGDGTKWWLGEISSWGKGVKNIGLGAKDDQAEALAQVPGVVAVCGAKPLADDIDAAAWLHRPNQAVEERLFDFVKPDLGMHWFAETARDCAFAGPVLVLVGEVFGAMMDTEPKRNHRLVLEHDTSTKFDTWTVAGPGQGTQSRALAIDIDDQGRYLVAGVSCDDSCEPDGELRVYTPGGTLAWQAPLGPMNNELAGPNDIAWSPAGHIVVALAEPEGQTLRFKVQAFAPGVFEPLWTFLPKDAQGLQIALALAIGDLGEVYAGGVGANNFPAVAYIAG
jgi:hypothetical protein